VRQILSITRGAAHRRHAVAPTIGAQWTLARCRAKITSHSKFREDKEKNMSSLFARKRTLNPELLTLPAFCIPAEESAQLEAKRQAQLEWMRAQGVQYILQRPVHRQTPIEERRVA
jgi:hypothetical protein